MFSVAMISGEAVGGTHPPGTTAAEHTGQLCELRLVIRVTELHVTEPHPHILEANLKRKLTNQSQARGPGELRHMAAEVNVQRNHRSRNSLP